MVEPGGEEIPDLPELCEVFLSLGVERIYLAWRSLL
jgi:hypothetical protein